VLAEGERTIQTDPYSGWDYASPQEIMLEIAALTRRYAGVSHARLRSGETFQWPVKDVTHPGTPILHVGQFPRGLGKFSPIEHIPPAELPDDEYPMVLSTGRVLYHWHGGEMTRRAQGLLEIYSKPLIEVNEGMPAPGPQRK
jgi:formate dehydrogenase major subunit/formate dehydrogenase alpha subunit